MLLKFTFRKVDLLLEDNINFLLLPLVRDFQINSMSFNHQFLKKNVSRDQLPACIHNRKSNDLHLHLPFYMSLLLLKTKNALRNLAAFHYILRYISMCCYNRFVFSSTSSLRQLARNTSDSSIRKGFKRRIHRFRNITPSKRPTFVSRE